MVFTNKNNLFLLVKNTLKNNLIIFFFEKNILYISTFYVQNSSVLVLYNKKINKIS
jgi:hypothetical protein